MNVGPPQHQWYLDRRRFLSGTLQGVSSLALAWLLGEDSARGETPAPDLADPYAPRPAHRPARAQNVIVIFCSGALSHVDTFDYKPQLIRSHGKPLPGNERLVSFQGPNGNLTKPLWPFQPRGQCGKMTSDLLPAIGALADEICFIHSLTNKSNTHGPA